MFHDLDWSKVITNPLGLIGFALFLLFLYWANTSDQPRWVKGWIASIITLVIVGSLALAYRQAITDQKEPERSRIEQKTEGDSSPAIQGVEGDVNLKYEQGSRGGQDK